VRQNVSWWNANPAEAGLANDYSGTCLASAFAGKKRVSQTTFPGRTYLRGRTLPVRQGGLMVLLVRLTWADKSTRRLIAAGVAAANASKNLVYRLCDAIAFPALAIPAGQ
jgi:hypothetical protein